MGYTVYAQWPPDPTLAWEMRKPQAPSESKEGPPSQGLGHRQERRVAWQTGPGTGWGRLDGKRPSKMHR